jgi:hypothetical protein
VCRSEVFVDLLEELRTGLKITETYIALPGKSAEERAELRGREAAYRICVDQLRRAICQHDRQGEPSLPEAAIAHLEAAERLLQAVEVRGFKSEYSKGMCGDSLIASRRALIGLWNVTSE